MIRTKTEGTAPEPAGEPPARVEAGLRHPSRILGLAMLVMGACGINYEYTLGVLGNNLLGSSHEQIFVVIGIMLFAMGVGSALQGRIEARLLDRFVLLEFLLGLTGGFSCLVVYAAFAYLTSYQPVLYLFAFLVGALIGLEIPIAIRLNERFRPSLRWNLSEMLGMDYVGALLGALLFTYVLLTRLSLARIALALGLLNVGIGLAVLLYFWSLVERPRRLLAIGLGLLFSLAAGFVLVDRAMGELEQRTYEDPIVYRETSPYQHIVLTRRGDELSLFLNGHRQFSSRDEAIYHELLVHVPLALAARRERVLILGGGDGLALREVLRYRDVERVDLVDIDAAITRLAAQHPELVRLNEGAFADARVVRLEAGGLRRGEPVELSRPAHGERRDPESRSYPIAEVRLLHLDADLFLREVKEDYDAVIIDFPDPRALEIAKLYSVDFYRRLRAHLRRGALISVQATSPYYARRAFLCIGETLRAAGLVALPYHDNVPSFGEWGWYLATAGSEVDGARLLESLEQLEKLEVSTRYVTPELLRASFVFGRGWLEVETPVVPNTRFRYALLDDYRQAWKR